MELKRRVAIYTVFVTFILIIYTIFYRYGMAVFEGRELSYAEALQTVVQSLTTTGYGQDAPWETTVMNLFTILMQFSGVFLVFLILPLFVIPWIEELVRFRQFDTVESFEDHIVICGHTSLIHSFIEELESHPHSHPYVIIESDRDRAEELFELGHTVLHGDPESESVLKEASIHAANGVVVTGDDETTLNVSLAVRDITSEPQLVAIVEESTVIPYLQYAGVDYILRPRQVLGQAIATRVLPMEPRRVLILGHGTVGSTVRSALERRGVQVIVVDIESDDHVDVVGDATNEQILFDAGIGAVDSIIISLGDDRQAVYATVLAREHGQDTAIFVRATEEETVGRLERAGADYTLELPKICGQMLAVTLLDEPVDVAEGSLVVKRITDSSRVAKPLHESTLGTEGEKVIAVIRDDDLILAPDPDFVLRTGDMVIIT